jgi:periplasmic protein TonB
MVAAAPTEYENALVGPDSATAGVAPVKDRLTTTIFLAALFHGIVILGVTFASIGIDNRPTPTLEVLLTNSDTSGVDNPDARYLAQSSQEGGGTTSERVRPANPASSLMSAEQAGVADGNSDQYKESVSGQPAAEIVSSRSEQSDVDYRSGEPQPSQRAEVAMALSPNAPSPIVTNATDDMLQLRGVRPDGTQEIIPDTRESRLAPYLDAWRHKVERLGTINFPNVARAGKLTGNPVLEVSLQRDGKLGVAQVKRSSGRKEIDQAALSILRLASPFDPFPAELKQYQELRFAYEWQFLTTSAEKTGAAQ